MKTSKIRTRQMRGEMARWCAENDKTMESLGKIIGLGKTTIYNRYNDPNKFTALEMAMLSDVGCQVKDFI